MVVFDFHIPCDIRFGAGRVKELGEVVASFGRPRVLLVTGRRALAESGTLDSILELLRVATKKVVHFRLEAGEPRPADVDDGAALARVELCRLVVGVGGGAALDAAKAIAAMAPLSDPVESYIEGVGDGRTLDKPGLPCVAIPTTAGTGAEVTRNAVLVNRERGYKRSLRSVHLVPRVAIVDPELTISAPPAVTAASGMDAIVQLIESYVSRKAQPPTDALAERMLPVAAAALERACADSRDLAARAVMAEAALYSGIALSHAGLGVVHGLASPVGARTSVPHGVACARMAPEAVRANARALAARADDPFARMSLERLARVGRWLAGRAAGDPRDDALAGAERLAELNEKLRVPRFRDFGVTEADIESIAANPGGNVKTNPVALSAEAMKAIVRSAL